MSNESKIGGGAQAAIARRKSGAAKALKLLRFLSLRFVSAFFRNCALKLRYGARMEFDIFSTYISRGASVRVSGSGRIVFGRGGRIFIGPGCQLLASDGILSIGPGVFFNSNCHVVAHQYIQIGADSMFGPGSGVFDSDHNAARADMAFRYQGYKREPVVLGRNVWLGMNSVVTRGTQIGENTVIGACSLARGVLESNCVYVGNPIRLARRIQ